MEKGENPIQIQTCLDTIINENRVSTLGKLKEFLTLKESIHYFLHDIIGLTRNSVLYLKSSGQSLKDHKHGE